mmetsp:Transcript_4238/g.12934  ORF Transcript_4238/g.12934 Transcript_4238/m.12934 type:complete len:409 (-) Transcript_4238:98-1324(-)
MVLVAVLEWDQVGVPILGEVQICVKARVRDVGVGVRTREVHAARLFQVPAAATREARTGHDVGSCTLRKQGTVRDAERLCQVVRVCHNIAQRDLGWRLHEPRLERQVLSLGLEAVCNEIAAEDQEHALLHVKGDRLHLQVRPRMQGERATLVVNQVEAAKLPPPNELNVLLDEVLLVDVIVVEWLRCHRALLTVAGEGQPDHPLRAAHGVEAHAVPGHWAHDPKEAGDVHVVLLQVAVGGAHACHVLLIDGIQGADVRYLALALTAEEVREELLLRHFEVLPLSLDQCLSSGLIALCHLDVAPVLCGELVVDVSAEVKERLLVIGPSEVETALGRRRRAVLPEILLCDAEHQAFEGADQILPAVLDPVHSPACEVVGLHGDSAALFWQDGAGKPMDLHELVDELLGLR